MESGDDALAEKCRSDAASDDNINLTTQDVGRHGCRAEVPGPLPGGRRDGSGKLLADELVQVVVRRPVLLAHLVLVPEHDDFPVA